MKLYADLFFAFGVASLIIAIVFTSKIKKDEAAAEFKTCIPAPVIPTEPQQGASTETPEETPTERYFPRYRVNADVPLDAELQIHAQMMCEEYHVNYKFFLAMCESESSFDVDAIGDSGKSQGLMQINKCNWTRYDLDASMVYDNIEIGVRMLAELIEKYDGNFDAVVMAYKGGEAFADEWLKAGKRLDACETVFDRTIYYSKLLEGSE